MSNSARVTVSSVLPENRDEFMPYLLQADENKEIIETYIRKGEMFSIREGEYTVGAVLFIPEDDQTIELKNIAIDASSRGTGLGRAVIEEAILLFKEKGFTSMIVGTANSSIENIVFYQKAGFRISGVRKGFFEDYPETFYENGIRALDMVMFERKISEERRLDDENN
ncbi:GNAT family N-acetyltransferase [Jeotgalibacillus campisalis]|uniref:Acyltransferase n=1 Tax=Jeotgalibacillus campisalis TaxID=220754 RepID=A0A0C2SAD2_9BACL|nr:GNAT family N-acetyltransferase [Jeotgalibacillus campisalis]KIL50919.1 acyltransferase [Jeotgalibacillus campisalis]